MVFIDGKKIYLRGLQQADLETGYISWLNDPEVCQFNNHNRFPYSAEQSSDYIKNSYNKSNLILAICEKENHTHIGNISLQCIDWINRNAEFAILLGIKKFWKKGYAKEAGKLIINHGFNELNLQRIYCGTSEKNIGMQKLAAYLNMDQEGVRRKAIFKHGEYLDMLEYGILNE